MLQPATGFGSPLPLRPVTQGSMETAERIVRRQATTMLGHVPSANDVGDLCMLIAVAVGMHRCAREASDMGPRHDATRAYLELAERWQRGL